MIFFDEIVYVSQLELSLEYNSRKILELNGSERN